jgi:uncharacterized protein
MRYLDTSALVKLATLEPETPALRAHLARPPEVQHFASMLAHAELLRAVQPAGAEAVAAARRVLASVHLVDVTREILERAGTLRVPQLLRTLDAIHLATALVAQDRLEEIITYDHRLGAAAASLGLTVTAPAEHAAAGS